VGQPIKLTLKAGYASDIGQAETLLAEHESEPVIADKGYDSDKLVCVFEKRMFCLAISIH
jgi:hypothetical protein